MNSTKHKVIFLFSCVICSILLFINIFVYSPLKNQKDRSLNKKILLNSLHDNATFDTERENKFLKGKLVQKNAISKIENLHSILGEKDSYVYTADWESLDKRPLPEWYDNDKIGIFMHYGLYSVPSIVDEWFQERWKRGSNEIIDFMKKNYPPNFKYEDFAKDFKAEFFDADKWADLVHKSGAKYYVITTKHHDGFALWPSSTSPNWNSVDVGPHKNFIGELTVAMRKKNIKVCLYISILEWANQLSLEDEQANPKTSKYIDNILIPQLHELVNEYKPDCLWADGHWWGTSDYFKTDKFIAWLFNDSPIKNHVVVNDRWGKDTICKHGSFRTCDDRYLPNSPPKYKFENAFTLDKKSWGYRRNLNLHDILTFRELLLIILKTICIGGNAVVNVGPTPEGTILPIFEDRLILLGEWLRINGESVYNTTIYKIQMEEKPMKILYTQNKILKSTIYIFLLKWNSGSYYHFKTPRPIDEHFTVSILGCSVSPSYSHSSTSGLVVMLPSSQDCSPVEVLVLKLVGFE